MPSYLVSIIIGMYSNCTVSKHSFNTSRRHCQFLDTICFGINHLVRKVMQNTEFHTIAIASLKVCPTLQQQQRKRGLTALICQVAKSGFFLLHLCSLLRYQKSQFPKHSTNSLVVYHDRSIHHYAIS